MQYKTGSISVYFPSGDTFTYTVLGNGTSWLANASAGDVLYIGTSAAPYVIGRVISDTELRVISPVSQEYEQEDYSIVRDFTLNFNLPLLSMQDRNAPDIISRAFQILDEKCSIPLTGYDELMFDNDENIGLYFHVRAGALRINNDIVLFNAATIELNDDSTLLVGIDETGELDFIDYVSGEEYPDRFLPLYIVQTLGGAVYHVDDIRAPYFVPYGLCYYQDDMEITGTWHFSSVKVEDVEAGSVSASNIVSSYGTIPYLKTTLLYADSGETININNEIDVDGDVYCHRIYADAFAIGETQFAEITPPSGESLVLNGDVIVNGSLTLYGDGSGNDVIMQSDNGKLSLNSDLTIGVNTFYCGTVYTDSVNSPIGTFDGISLGSLILYNNTISSESGEDIYIDTGSGVLYINGEEYSGGSGGGGGSIDWVLSCTSDSPSELLSMIETAGVGGSYSDGTEIYYMIYTYTDFDNVRIFSTSFASGQTIIENDDAAVALSCTAVDGVGGYRFLKEVNNSGIFYYRDENGDESSGILDYGTEEGWTALGAGTMEPTNGVTTTTINSADGVYGVHTNKDVYGRAFYGDGTRWKDWAAVAACGAAVVWDGNRGRNVGWSPGYGDEAGCYFDNYLLSDDYGQRVYFPIPYEAGTILTRLRVKWCANAQDNGIKVRLVKRDETAYNDSWTVVGAQQSYIDSAGDLNININTYDFADETMQANHSYAIEVESVVDNPVGVRLYSFGIETSKRVY